VYDVVYKADQYLPRRGPGCRARSGCAGSRRFRAELIRDLIDRALGGHPGADLVADVAAIDGSFGILDQADTFARVRDERMSYLERLADT
jgi:hypothetical protein